MWPCDAVWPGLTLYSMVSVLWEVSAVTCRLWTVGCCAASAVSSWKWVANRQKEPILEAMCSLMAQARPKPSYVEVPLPSSSMMMSEFSVAELEGDEQGWWEKACLPALVWTNSCASSYRRMAAVSSISDIKVETPLTWLSPAPTLARTLSITLSSAFSHGTKQPIWAIRAITPTWRINVDLPPIFGPTDKRREEV